MTDTKTKTDPAKARLSGTEKATILLLSLGDDVAAEVLKILDPKDVQQLASCATRLPSVDENVIDSVQEEFIEKLTGGASLGVRHSREKIRSILGRFLPHEQIEKYLDTMTFSEDLSEGFEAIKYIDAETIAAFIREEHPQTIALILAHLDLAKSAQVLPLLSQEDQAEIIMRIANLDRVSPIVVKNIQEVFVQEILASGASKSRQVGGAESVAELMNNLDSKSVQAIFGELEGENPEFCEQIRALMFVFTDLIKLDNKSLQLVIKEVSNDVLTMALKTAPDELREKIFKNISSRAAELIREELEVMGPVKLSEVEAAQIEIVNIARRLEEEGKIVLSGGAGGETLV